METRLKTARKAAGFNQQEAATAMKVSLGTYRNWEQGRVMMNCEQLIRLSQLFSVTVDYILMTDQQDQIAKDPRDELLDVYDNMSGDAQDALLIVARGLSEAFPK